ncbi:rod shape-determining protein MreD [Roseibacterium sp. SDUM158016]|jgi:rod shape-determining protein MreD|uniref:rod shape-determining protein MreD n=1 Tax=Roseicyclus sediminis TaxID=2980997 RepID=UPI0021CFC991|nr:rod shape-determining protein MreD [Roseibacterium sp. SDUM158016]MCU4652921.1 rod shape-determining protein MreD [Roseibacterium sp. SDUM158016]
MSPATSARHVWTYRALFLLLCAALITLRLLPLGLGESGLPGPDLILALTFAWLLRQPAVVPLVSIVAVFLVADFLLQRPPGLWTALAVVASESLRRRRLQMTEFPFLVEWGAIAGAVAGMVLAERVILWMLFVDPPSLGLALTHGIVTVAIYPLVVAVSKFIFGLRKLGPAELEPL